MSAGQCVCVCGVLRMYVCTWVGGCVREEEKKYFTCAGQVFEMVGFLF